jgi:hypothetical protein
MSDAFYVGYLDAPPNTARRMRRVAFALVALAGVAATVLAIATGPFDRASYDYATEREWHGRLELSPVPALMATTFPIAGSPFATIERYPLVAQGKHGADALVAGFGGTSVRLKARRIVRGGTTMLEVVPGTIARFEQSLPENGAPAPASKIEDLGRATYSGEIVDSKCFLGVMNPGRLEVHRACAIRCIAGGIPPMLFVREKDGREAHLLLVDANGRPLNDRVLGLVARPVTISGRLERRDNLHYLYVNGDILLFPTKQ